MPSGRCHKDSRKLKRLPSRQLSKTRLETKPSASQHAVFGSLVDNTPTAAYATPIQKQTHNAKGGPCSESPSDQPRCIHLRSATRLRRRSVIHQNPTGACSACLHQANLWLASSSSQEESREPRSKIIAGGLCEKDDLPKESSPTCERGRSETPGHGGSSVCLPCPTPSTAHEDGHCTSRRAFHNKHVCSKPQHQRDHNWQ